MVPVPGCGTGGSSPVSAGGEAPGPQPIAETPGEGRPQDYFPLTAPARREYDVEYKALILRGRGRMVTTVRTQEIDGAEYAAHTTSLTGTPWDFTHTSLYRASARGIMVRPAGEREERLFLPQPLRPGLNWTTELDGVPARHEVVGREDVVCGRTTYRGCMKVVSASDSGSKTLRWFAPDVGVVKQETSGSSLSSTTTLTSVE
jgi:hypothetical protein